MLVKTILNHHSKISPTYPWKIPQKFHQQFMKEFLSLWGFGVSSQGMWAKIGRYIFAPTVARLLHFLLQDLHVGWITSCYRLPKKGSAKRTMIVFPPFVRGKFINTMLNIGKASGYSNTIDKCYSNLEEVSDVE